MYLTYLEYEEFGFDSIDESDFNRHARKAKRHIRLHTQNRSDKAVLGEYASDIKECMGLLIQLEIYQEKALNELETGLEISRKGISSESVTDHSVSFQNHSENKQLELENTYRKTVKAIITDCLLWTGLLYRGI